MVFFAALVYCLFLLKCSDAHYCSRRLIVSATRTGKDIKIKTVGLREETFNIVSNDHGRMHKCDFSVFERKYPFWANLVKKNKNCQSKLKFGIKTNSNMQNSMVLFFLF